jgi:hypothetical protein
MNQLDIIVHFNDVEKIIIEDFQSDAKNNFTNYQ